MIKYDFTKKGGEVENLPDLIHKIEFRISHITNGDYEIIIRRKIKIRSVSQNRLMWMWFSCISKETGNNVDDVHDYYVRLLLPPRNVEIGEKTFTLPGKTSALTVEQMTEFLNGIQADAAAELGIKLPTPEDLMWEEFYNEYGRSANET